MNLRSLLGYGDLAVTCYLGLRARPRRRLGGLRRRPVLAGLDTLCRLVPRRARAGAD